MVFEFLARLAQSNTIGICARFPLAYHMVAFFALQMAILDFSKHPFLGGLSRLIYDRFCSRFSRSASRLRRSEHPHGPQ